MEFTTVWELREIYGYKPKAVNTVPWVAFWDHLRRQGTPELDIYLRWHKQQRAMQPPPTPPKEARKGKQCRPARRGI